MNSIKAQVLREVIVRLAKKGEIFNVAFVKKDGSLRTMNARLHVHKGVKGTSPFDTHASDVAHGQLRVYDMDKEISGKETKGAFRKINLNTLKKLSVKGETIWMA